MLPAVPVRVSAVPDSGFAVMAVMAVLVVRLVVGVLVVVDHRLVVMIVAVRRAEGQPDPGGSEGDGKGLEPGHRLTEHRPRHGRTEEGGRGEHDLGTGGAELVRALDPQRDGHAVPERPDRQRGEDRGGVTTLPNPGSGRSGVGGSAPVGAPQAGTDGWMTPGDLVSEGFRRASVVMVNEGHNGLARCIRARRIGREVLVDAHAAGCRTLAAEALPNTDGGLTRHATRPAWATRGYLAQPEMIELLDAAVSLGWTLVAYEADARSAPPELAADTLSPGFTNWREEQQAAHLAELATGLDGEPLLVWVGNDHHSKATLGDGWWQPMGAVLVEEHGIDHFAIDQLATVALAPGHSPMMSATAAQRAVLESFGGTAGYLTSAPPPGVRVRHGVDAVIWSTDNAVTE